MKSRLSTVALSALLLAGCAMPPMTVTTPGGTTPGSSVKPGTGATTPGATLTDPKTGKPIPNQPVEPLNGIEFKPLSPTNAQFVGNGGNLVASGGMNGSGGATASRNASGPAPAAAPGMAESATMAGDAAFGAPTPTGMAKAGVAMDSKSSVPPAGGPGGGAFSGNMWSHYGFGYYFGGGGGFGEQMALVSLQEASTNGSTGSFQEIVGNIAAPVVKAWAADARLIESGTTLDNQGQLFVEPGVDPTMAAGMDAKMAVMPMPYPGPGGYDGTSAWRLVYASSERREVLQFTVKKDKTTIIRMRWAPLDLAPERVQTDSRTAVASVIKAVTDKSFRGAEEKSGLDYFLGHKFEQPKTGEWDGDYQKTEVLYEVPKDARWNITLTQVMGKLVWDLNWNAPWNPPAMRGGGTVGIALPAMTMAEPAVDMEVDARRPAIKPECAPPPPQEPNFYVNYWGQAMVDAETGEVIRFSRPTKVTYNYPQPDYGYACPAEPPKPMPAETKPPVDPNGEPEPDVEDEDAEGSEEQ